VTASDVAGADRLRLARGVRLTYNAARRRHVLQRPEAVIVLNGTGADILGLCDGRRTVAEIVDELGCRYQGVPAADVRRFLTRLVDRRCLVLDGEPADG
jgi:pyrroloquinoline quinone biosynthesis protein D